MRIALVSDTYTPQVNGVTTVLERIVGVLHTAGHAVALVAPAYASEGGPPRQDELRVASVPFPPYPAIRLSIPRFHTVQRFLDGFGPDLVHVATEGPLGFVGRRYALEHGVPLVTSAHTDFPQYCRYYGAPSLQPLAWRFLAWFHRPAALTHAPGGAMQRALTERGVRHVVRWGCGVDVEHFRPGRRGFGHRRALGLREDAVLVLHVGRLAREKDVDVLLQGWRLAHETVGRVAQFVVAGEGPMAGRVDAEASWIRRLGFLDRNALADLYASADLCVVPSRTETCGLVALEAMASGLPVVAAAAGGFLESVESGSNGALIAPGDARGFAAAVARLVLDPEERTRMSQSARATALARDLRRENEALLLQYASLVEHHPRRSLWRAA
jgi:phosphatidylinositol alpha 1,6-mannosyltransferase